LQAMDGVGEVQLEMTRLAVRVASDDLVPGVVAALAGQGAQIMRVNPRQHSLEDVYFELQNQEKEGRP